MGLIYLAVLIDNDSWSAVDPLQGIWNNCRHLRYNTVTATRYIGKAGFAGIFNCKMQNAK